MELVNSSRMAAGYTIGMEPSGREFLVVVIKGTFRIPVEQGEPLRLHEEQVPLVMNDEFFGEPGVSAPKYEVDFALRKRRCDVLLNSTAYAPGRPARRVEVAAHIGGWSKSFAVVGDRMWEADGVGIGVSSPIPFETMPITYDYAFGGADSMHADPCKHAPFMANPSGRGFHSHLVKKWIHNTPLPNTEEIGKPVNSVNGSYRPMSFGPIGRHWASRAAFAGTYDQTWLDEHFPFLPPDFDDLYYQSAPPDQQLPTPLGQQRVMLSNLTPDRQRCFTLPHWEAPVFVFPKKGKQEELTGVLDTIVIEPDIERVMMTWRVSRPIARSVFEIGQVLVGKGSPAWWRARRSGKLFYASLRDLDNA